MKIYCNMATLTTIALLVLASFSVVHAEAPPTTISYQGFLADSSGIAIASATYGIQAEIYEVLSGGTAVYSETHDSVTVSSGRFAIELGAGAASIGSWSTSVDFSKALWLQITIGTSGTDEPLLPRIALRPAPYARMAQAVADGVTLTSPIIDGGTVNNAAIGATAPSTGAFTTLSSSNTFSATGTVTLSNTLTVSGATTLNGGLSVKNGSTSAGTIAIYENSNNGSNKVTLQAQALSSDYTLTLPTDEGTNGQLLSTDGNGVLSWASATEGDVTTTGTQTLTNKTLTSPTISGGAIDSATVGATTPSTGAFTTLSATGTSTLSTVAVSGGTIDATTIGVTTPGTGAFTTLSASGAVSLSSSLAVAGTTTLTGASTLTNAVIRAGSIDSTTIGATTPSSGKFTTLSASDAVSLSNSLSVDGATTFTGASTTTGIVSLNNGSTSSGQLRIYENSTNGINYTAFQAASSMTGDITYTLPETDGSNGQVLSTNGGGILSWSSAGGGGDVTTTGEQTLTNKTLTSSIINGTTITAGTIDNTPVGANIPSTGAFTTLAASGTVSLSDSLTVAGTTTLTGASTLTNTFISAGSIDSTTIGETTPSSGKFTALSASGAVSLSDSLAVSGTTTLTGASTLTNAVISAGSIDSTTIGATTPSSGKFTTLSASGTASLSNSLSVDGTTTFNSGSTTTGVVSLKNATTSGQLRIYEDSTNGDNYTAFQGASSMTNNVTYTLPETDGSSGQFLSTNGAGALSWAAAGGGLSNYFESPASNYQISVTLTGRQWKEEIDSGLKGEVTVDSESLLICSFAAQTLGTDSTQTWYDFAVKDSSDNVLPFGTPLGSTWLRYGVLLTTHDNFFGNATFTSMKKISAGTYDVFVQGSAQFDTTITMSGGKMWCYTLPISN